MNIDTNVDLAPYTAFGVGGPAEQLITLTAANEFSDQVNQTDETLTVLGYGANVLISDQGLSGLVVIIKNDDTTDLIELSNTTITVDAACNWDELVKFSVNQNLWGLEMMSGIPGGVGAAIVGNIAAYGQAVADSLQSVTVFDPQTGETKQLAAEDLQLNYRMSNLQQPENQHLVVVDATFKLSPEPTTKLTYQRALDTATELNLSTDSLDQRRQIILETRRRAGSLLDPSSKTAGSFFRNPMVSEDQVEQIVKFDETGKTADQISKMNRVHGGDKQRVSAAHVLLAAGFHRGQTWGNVRLHPDHVLKIENIGGATAQDIYNVAQLIQSQVKDELNIDLIPEVRFLGDFK